MSRSCLVFACCAALWFAEGAVRAAEPLPSWPSQSWIFNRSYYSHQPATEVEVGPQSPHSPIFTRPQGAYIRGGYRRLRVGGNLRSNDDFHYFYESWFQVGEQF